VTLLEAIAEHSLRRLHRRRPPRRGKGARQGAHLLVPRRASASGTRRTSGPSCGPVQHPRPPASTCARFPISNWTELDVWQYIEREKLPLPSIYYAHRARWSPQGPAGAGDAVTPPRAGETVETVVGALSHRRRHHLHLPGRIRRRHAPRSSPRPRPSPTITERGATRMDDQTSDASMERRKKEGYF
jgi:sulfate adenylyltransferase subunit 2